jgi:PAS domain S-box-containing protein
MEKERETLLARIRGLESRLEELETASREQRSALDRLKSIVEIADDAIISVDKEQIIRMYNRGAEHIFGYAAGEVIGKGLNILLPGHLHKAHDNHMRVFAKSPDLSRKMGERREILGRRKDGSIFPAEASISKVTLENGDMAFTAILRDITESKLAEDRLRASREELRALAAHLEAVREEERKRIAHEIHDELGQNLTVLSMGLSWLQNEVGHQSVTASRETLLDRIADLIRLVGSSMETMRRISTELRPAMLEPFGLQAAIEWQAKEFQKHTGIECSLQFSGGLEQIESDLALVVYRIFQESLTNVARHSGATRVDVCVESRDKELVLQIADNGVGFEESRRSSRNSLGLVGMRERAVRWGGELQIDSEVDMGTRIFVRIPLGAVPGFSENHENDV